MIPVTPLLIVAGHILVWLPSMGVEERQRPVGTLGSRLCEQAAPGTACEHVRLPAVMVLMFNLSPRAAMFVRWLSLSACLLTLLLLLLLHLWLFLYHLHTHLDSHIHSYTYLSVTVCSTSFKPLHSTFLSLLISL